MTSSLSGAQSSIGTHVECEHVIVGGGVSRERSKELTGYTYERCHIKVLMFCTKSFAWSVFLKKKTSIVYFYISKPKRAHNFWSIYFSNKVFATVKKSAQVEFFLFHLSLGNLDFAFPLHPEKTNAAMSRVRFVVFSSLSFTSMNKKGEIKLLLDKTFQHFPRVLFAF